MTPEQIDKLIEAHVKAEKAGDFDAAVAMYTDDIEHDVVGCPPAVHCVGPTPPPRATNGSNGTWSKTSWSARAPSTATTSV